MCFTLLCVTHYDLKADHDTQVVRSYFGIFTHIKVLQKEREDHGGRWVLDNQLPLTRTVILIGISSFKYSWSS